MQKRSGHLLPWLMSLMVLALIPAPPATAAVSPGHQVIVSADPVDWTPHVRGGQVNAIAVVGNKVIVGGTFTEVRRSNSMTFLPRVSLFAFDRSTGVIDTAFVPILDGAVETLAVAPDGQSVFIGGVFNTVNGTTRRKVALVSTVNGQLITAFQANASAKVLDLAVVGNRLFMAGAFATVRSVPAQGLAAVNVSTGVVDPGVNFTFTAPRSGTQRVMKIDVTLDGSRLAAIGNFQLVSGLDRKQIVMFDLTTSPVTIANWQTNQFPQVIPGTTTSWCSAGFDTYMRDVSFSPDGSFFVVGTTGAFRANRMCDTVSRWPTFTTGSDLFPTWVDWSGGDTTTGVAVTETAIYVGGHERWWNNPYVGDNPGPGAVPRPGIAALDPVNGLPFTWDPERDPRGVGVFALLPTTEGLWLGSDTDNIGGEFHGELALMPLAGGTAVPQIQTIGLPNDLYNLELGGAMVRRAYNGSTFGSTQTVPTGVNWGTARGAFVLNGRLYYGLSDGRLYSRTFDGTNVGPQVAIDLHGLEVQPSTAFLIPGTTTRVPALTTHLANATGMFYDQGRLYYTVRNEPRLYYRYFSLESQVVGANLLVASTSASVNWSQVSGMTLANGQLYLGSTTGSLSRIAFSNGQVSGSTTVVGGPGIDGTNWNARGLFVFGQAGGGDTTPPTQPGKPAGVSTSTSTIDLTWAASTDNQSTQITYRIFRDGGTTPVGTVTSSSTTTVSFTDTGLAPGSTHTYRVDARDTSLNTSSLSVASDPITTMSGGGGVIFADAFASGNFAAWTTATNLLIDNTTGGDAPPSARGTPANLAAFARKDLGATFLQVCLSEAVNFTSAGGPVSLMRLRTASGGAIARVFVNGAGALVVKADVSGAQQPSAHLPAGWNRVELCGSVGSAGAWTLYLNGAPIVSNWVANTGTTPVGRIEIGDPDIKTWSGNFDDVVLDSTPG
ncbi:MAG: PKD domain containing protein [Actinomycetota bacterium]